jgi:hypothetical protein
MAKVAIGHQSATLPVMSEHETEIDRIIRAAKVVDHNA